MEQPNEEMDQVKVDFNRTFNSEHGRRVLEELLTFCHIMEPPAVVTDPHVVMFKAGRRDVAMYILEQMSVKSITELVDA